MTGYHQYYHYLPPISGYQYQQQHQLDDSTTLQQQHQRALDPRVGQQYPQPKWNMGQSGQSRRSTQIDQLGKSNSAPSQTGSARNAGGSSSMAHQAQQHIAPQRVSQKPKPRASTGNFKASMGKQSVGKSGSLKIGEAWNVGSGSSQIGNGVNVLVKQSPSRPQPINILPVPHYVAYPAPATTFEDKFRRGTTLNDSSDEDDKQQYEYEFGEDDDSSSDNDQDYSPVDKECQNYGDDIGDDWYQIQNGETEPEELDDDGGDNDYDYNYEDRNEDEVHQHHDYNHNDDAYDENNHDLSHADGDYGGYFDVHGYSDGVEDDVAAYADGGGDEGGVYSGGGDSDGGGDDSGGYFDDGGDDFSDGSG